MPLLIGLTLRVLTILTPDHQSRAARAQPGIDCESRRVRLREQRAWTTTDIAAAQNPSDPEPDLNDDGVRPVFVAMPLGTDGKVRVVTLNVWNRDGAWPDRRSVLAEGLQRLDPDLVTFQESVVVEEYDQVADLLGSGYTIIHQAGRAPTVWAPRLPAGGPSPTYTNAT